MLLKPIINENLEIVDVLLVVVYTLLTADDIADEKASTHSIGAFKVLLVANVRETYSEGCSQLQTAKIVGCPKMQSYIHSFVRSSFFTRVGEVWRLSSCVLLFDFVLA